MADKPPAPLSRSLLARKGAASASGFAHADGGPATAPSSRRWRLAVFSTTLSISAAAIALVGAALMFGGPWTATVAPEPTVRIPVPDSAVPSTAAVAVAARGAVPSSSPPAVSPTPEPKPAPAVSPVRTAEPTKAPPPSPRRRPAGPARAGYLVQLHALASDAAVRREWRRLRQRHGKLFADLDLTVAPTRSDGGGGTVYRMRLGALSSRTDARALCKKLRREEIGCMVVR